MIVAVHCELILQQNLGQLCVAAHVFAESMGDLNHSTDVLRTNPLHARYGKTVSTCELESLWLFHDLYMDISALTHSALLMSPKMLAQNLLQYFARAALW